MLVFGLYNKNPLAFACGLFYLIFPALLDSDFLGLFLLDFGEANS